MIDTVSNCEFLNLKMVGLDRKMAKNHGWPLRGHQMIGQDEGNKRG